MKCRRAGIGGARLNGGSGRPLYFAGNCRPAAVPLIEEVPQQLKIAEKQSAVKLIFLILLIMIIYQLNPFSLNKVIA